MGNEVLAAVEATTQLELDWRVAKALAMSGLFPDARKAEQAFAKILLGRDLGLNPTQAMTGIHIVEGKPQVAAVTLGAFVREGGSYDYRVLEHTDELCTIEFGAGKAPGHDQDGSWLPWPDALGVSTFAIEDARKAGLVKEKSGWAKYPRNMLFARAMSNGVKWYCPDVTHGVPVYHEGEIEPRRLLEAGERERAITFDELVALVPDDLRERFTDALRDADEVRPGEVTLPAAEMSVRDQPRERVVEYLEEVGRANAARAASVTNGEVEEVPEADASDAIRLRIKELEERLLGVDQMSEEAEVLEQEIQVLQDQL